MVQVHQAIKLKKVKKKKTDSQKKFLRYENQAVKEAVDSFLEFYGSCLAETVLDVSRSEAGIMIKMKVLGRPELFAGEQVLITKEVILSAITKEEENATEISAALFQSLIYEVVLEKLRKMYGHDMAS